MESKSTWSFCILLTAVLIVNASALHVERSNNHQYTDSTRYRRSEDHTRGMEIADINQLGGGSCEYNDLAIGAQICESLFFREFILNPSASCSKLFEMLQDCISTKWNECSKGVATARHSRSAQSTLLYYVETGYCNDGGLSLPNPSQPVNYCDINYIDEVERCIGNYHTVFRSNPGDEDLCEMYEDSRRCLQDAQKTLCTYPEILQFIQSNSEALYRCWNPFCVWRGKMSQTTQKDDEENQIKVDFNQARNFIELKLRNSRLSTNNIQASPGSTGVPKQCQINRARLLAFDETAKTNLIQPIKNTMSFVNTEPEVSVADSLNKNQPALSITSSEARKKLNKEKREEIVKNNLQNPDSSTKKQLRKITSHMKTIELTRQDAKKVIDKAKKNIARKKKHNRSSDGSAFKIKLSKFFFLLNISIIFVLQNWSLF